MLVSSLSYVRVYVCVFELNECVPLLSVEYIRVWKFKIPL